MYPILRVFRVFGLLGAVLLLSGPAAAETLRLSQKPDVVLEHQRMPGNARAQAERRGVIRSVPHLFVYHPDARHSPAFYLNGFRRGFERQLAPELDRFRVQRSMVPLERLLTNAVNADGRSLTPGDLPRRRAVFVLYRSADCDECDLVAGALDAWLGQRPAFQIVRIEIDVALP
jgi:hypothetical protein